MEESRQNAQDLFESSPFSGNGLSGRSTGSEQKKKQHKHNAAELKAQNDANVANMFEVMFFSFSITIVILDSLILHRPS